MNAHLPADAGPLATGGALAADVAARSRHRVAQAGALGGAVAVHLLALALWPGLPAVQMPQGSAAWEVRQIAREAPGGEISGATLRTTAPNVEAVVPPPSRVPDFGSPAVAAAGMDRTGRTGRTGRTSDAGRMAHPDPALRASGAAGTGAADGTKRAADAGVAADADGAAANGQATAAASAAASVVAAPAQAGAAEHPDTALALMPGAEAGAAGPPTPESDFANLPVYRTVPPPSTALHFTITRGESLAAARLSWHLQEGGGYLMELRTQPDAAAARPRAGERPRPTPAPQWSSRGQLDAAGLAPERFAVSRRGRERHAANFQRDKGLVSFAGPTRTWPLAAGAQDRLSWIVQLASILQAQPELAQPGAPISMMVVGAHGDAAVWTFVVQGPEVIGGPQGEPMATVRLHRAARAAHDPQVEVWLAPSLHHLPVRLRLIPGAARESTEWRLRALQAP